jgi:hypothetical protein
MAFTGCPRVKAFLQHHARRLKERHEREQQHDSKAPQAPYYQKLAAEGCLIDCPASGFVCRLDHVDQQNLPIPFVVPGPAADVSVGVAIAHFKSPLQDVVRAAQSAEKRAKKQHGRSAVAITLFKRSGEIIHWGTKWDSGGLELYRAIAEALDAGNLSAKFTYRVVELLEPYRTTQHGLSRQEDADSFDAMAVIQKEFVHAISRQSAPGRTDSLRADLEPLLRDFLGKVAAEWDGSATAGKLPSDSKCQRLLNAVIGLCQTVAFAHRTSAEAPALLSSVPSAAPVTETERQPA